MYNAMNYTGVTVNLYKNILERKTEADRLPCNKYIFFHSIVSEFCQELFKINRRINLTHEDEFGNLLEFKLPIKYKDYNSLPDNSLKKLYQKCTPFDMWSLDTNSNYELTKIVEKLATIANNESKNYIIMSDVGIYKRLIKVLRYLLT